MACIRAVASEPAAARKACRPQHPTRQAPWPTLGSVSPKPTQTIPRESGRVRPCDLLELCAKIVTISANRDPPALALDVNWPPIYWMPIWGQSSVPIDRLRRFKEPRLRQGNCAPHGRPPDHSTARISTRRRSREKLSPTPNGFHGRALMGFLPAAECAPHVDGPGCGRSARITLTKAGLRLRRYEGRATMITGELV